jgi:gliding motility-associated-like protein
MKRLLYILLFLPLSANIYSQQVVELCNDSETLFEYSSQSSVTGGTYVWSVGTTQVGSGTSTNIDWANYGIGTYSLILQFYDDILCPSEPVSYTVNVVECPNTEMWIPNAFTPDGDENNNVWRPVGYNYKEGYFEVYNRWGELIFESHDFSVGWDGSYKGGQYFVQDGVYVYKVYWVDIKNKRHVEYGHIALIR